MAEPVKILAVAGFRIQVGDDSAYWDLIEAVDEVENTSILWREWDTVKDDDLLGKDVVICYSWGVASVFKAMKRLRKAGKLPFLPILIILAGVPRGFGQWVEVKFGGGWKVPDEVGLAICVQVDSVPVSYPILQGEHAMRVNFLLTGIPGNDHVHIQNYGPAREIILATIQAAEQERNGTEEE